MCLCVIGIIVRLNSNRSVIPNSERTETLLWDKSKQRAFIHNPAGWVLLLPKKKNGSPDPVQKALFISSKRFNKWDTGPLNDWSSTLINLLWVYKIKGELGLDSSG